MPNYLGVEQLAPDKYKATAYCKQCKAVKILGEGQSKLELAQTVARFKGCSVNSLIIKPVPKRKWPHDIDEYHEAECLSTVVRKAKPIGKLRLVRDKIESTETIISLR